MKERFMKAVGRVAVVGMAANREDRRAHLSTERVPALRELAHVILCDERLIWQHKRRLLIRIRLELLAIYREQAQAAA